MKSLVLLLSVGVFFNVFASGSRAADKNKSKALAHYTMGIIYDNKGQPNLAVSEYRESLRHDPHSTLARLRLGVDYLALEEEKKAVKEFELIEKIDPENKQATFILALVYTSRGDLASAEKKYKTLIKGGFADTGIYITLAYVYIQGEKYEEALKLLDVVLAENPENVSAYFYKGVVYERKSSEKKDMEAKRKAEENFRKAISLDPHLAEAYNYLGYIFAEEGRNLDEAVLFTKKAVELDPENAAYIDSLGWAYFKKGMTQKALEELKKAASIAKEDPAIREHLGDAYFEEGLPDKARIQWEKALELDPGKKNIRKKIQLLKAEKEGAR